MLFVGIFVGVFIVFGVVLFDLSGVLCFGILLCLLEGDVGIGMVVMNFVVLCIGNVSVGISIFVMVVLE